MYRDVTVEDISTLNIDAGYMAWPTLAKTKQGELLLVCSGYRQRHVCPFGKVLLFRSKDSGTTWSKAEILADTLLDDRDSGVLETGKGTLLVSWFNSIAWLKTLRKEVGHNVELLPCIEQNWKKISHFITDEIIKRELGNWMIRSEDGGLSWSKKYRTGVISPHGMVMLKNGRLLYAGNKSDGLQDDSCTKIPIGIAESFDDGLTWDWLGDIPVRAGDDVNKYWELHLSEAASGRLVCHIRNHNTRNASETLQSESDDGGYTWSEPHPIGVWGLPSHLRLLEDGRLLMSYSYRREPFGIRARISADNAYSWSNEIILHDKGSNHDLGYPSTVELADGSFLTVWYEVVIGSEFAVLRQAKWNLQGICQYHSEAGNGHIGRPLIR